MVSPEITRQTYLSSKRDEGQLGIFWILSFLGVDMCTYMSEYLPIPA